MQLASFDESEEHFRENRCVEASINFFDGDKLVFKHYKEAILTPQNNNLTFLFKHLTVGDSAIFQIDTSLIVKHFPQLKKVNFKNQFIRAQVKVFNYLKNCDNTIDKEMLEQILLKKYLKENRITKQIKGIYIKQLSKGKGNVIENGKQITIHYKGYFINQIEFDNTYKKMDLTFSYGSPGQVIEGLQIALRGMKKGEKAKIIIPSQLAFGEEGSSTQIIPPYTTVIYELEIVNVK